MHLSNEEYHRPFLLGTIHHLSGYRTHAFLFTLTLTGFLGRYIPHIILAVQLLFSRTWVGPEIPLHRILWKLDPLLCHYDTHLPIHLYFYTEADKFHIGIITCFILYYDQKPYQHEINNTERIISFKFMHISRVC